MHRVYLESEVLHGRLRPRRADDEYLVFIVERGLVEIDEAVFRVTLRHLGILIELKFDPPPQLDTK